jgi:hypothetical protein
MLQETISRVGEDDGSGFASLPDTRFGKTGTVILPDPASHPGRAALLAQLAEACRGVPGSGRAGDHATRAGLPTGFDRLDAALPGGGWPVGAITELMPEAQGIGELSLLLPALAQLTRAGRQVAWIAPPCLPYPPALLRHGIALERLLLVQVRDARTALWATEQALRCPAIGAVLAWPAVLADRQVRRLQLAAEAGGSCGLLYRAPAAAAQHSPAALRLLLQAVDTGLRITIHKVRGGRTHALVVHPAAAACA